MACEFRPLTVVGFSRAFPLPTREPQLLTPRADYWDHLVSLPDNHIKLAVSVAKCIAKQFILGSNVTMTVLITLLG